MPTNAEEGTITCLGGLPVETVPLPRARTSVVRHVTQSERRYHYYSTIAKLLGVSGRHNRAKLPACVMKRIKEMFPDATGAPTKVGYKQDPEP